MVTTLTECLEELTNACLIMSYKYMCRHIFMRKYVEIDREYRCYVYKEKLRYIEEYCVNKNDEKFDHHDVKKNIESYVDQVTEKLSSGNFRDYTVDLGIVDGKLMVIEINTPLYLLAGLILSKYDYVIDEIHNAEKPKFKYQIDKEIYYIDD